MATHDTVRWPEPVKMVLDDGSIHVITPGLTTTDVAGGLVVDQAYYIYWTPNDPTKFHTVIASDTSYVENLSNTLVATVTGVASGGKAQIVYAGTSVTDGQNTLNAKQVVNQDSVTGTEISTVGSTATTGLRLKMSTAGTGAAGSGSTGAFLRGYTGNSISDTTGRWLDIDGDNQAIYFMDGSEANYILSSMSAAGMKFYSGTSATATDGTTRAHYGGSALTFYNGSGKAAGNELVSLGVGTNQGLNLFGSNTNTTHAAMIRYQGSVGGGWESRGYQGLFNDGAVDHLISYAPQTKIWLISDNEGDNATVGSTIHFETISRPSADAGSGAGQAGWKMHSSSDSGDVFRNYFFPVNSGSGTTIAGATATDGSDDGHYNYIGFQPGDTRDSEGTGLVAAPTISIIQSYYSSLGDGSALLPALYFDQDTGIYSPSDNAVGITAGGSLVAQFDSSGVTIGGALARTAGVEDMWIPAAAMRPTSSNGCAAITDVETTSGKPDLQVLDFDKDSDEFAQFSVAFPKSWNIGNVTFQAYWTSASTNTGTVAWAMSGTCIGDNDTIDESYPTPTVATAKAHSGTAEDLNISAVSGAMTIENAADGELTFFQILRDVSADDHSSDARLIGVKINYTTSAATDA
jgi:hypothetical protein